MGGNGEEENLIDLFAREHFEAHRLLAKENPNVKGLVYAWFRMSLGKNQDTVTHIVSSEEYEEARIAFSQARTGSKMSEKTRQKMSESHSGERCYWYGKELYKETKEKIKNAHIGLKASEETKRKMSEKRKGENHPMYGKCHSEESKQKMSDAIQNLIYCPELDEEFINISQASRKYNICRTTINNCILGKKKSAGKHPITGEKLHWVKLEK